MTEPCPVIAPAASGWTPETPTWARGEALELAAAVAAALRARVARIIAADLPAADRFAEIEIALALAARSPESLLSPHPRWGHPEEETSR